MTSRREISGSRLARSLTFLTISFFISWLAGNGKLAKIVHPRMNLWIEGAGVLFLVLAFAQMLSLSKKPRHSDPLSFFIPIAYVLAITFIFVQSNTFSTSRFDQGDDSVAVENAIFSKRDKIAAQASNFHRSRQRHIFSMTRLDEAAEGALVPALRIRKIALRKITLAHSLGQRVHKHARGG